MIEVQPIDSTGEELIGTVRCRECENAPRHSIRVPASAAFDTHLRGLVQRAWTHLRDRVQESGCAHLPVDSPW